MSSARPQVAAPDYFVFDFETTNSRKGSPFDNANQPVCVAWISWENGIRYDGYHHYHASWLQPFNFSDQDFYWDGWEVMPGRDMLMVGHNIKFDIHWWDRLGYPRGDRLWDTMFPPFIENPRAGKSLDAVVGGSGKLESGNIWVHELGLNPLDMDPRECVRYCVQDVLLTERLFLSQWERYRSTYNGTLETLDKQDRPA